MDGFHYLVMLHYQHDDVCVYLTDCQESAFDFAENTSWEDLDGPPCEGAMDLPDITLPPICVSIVTFRDGVPCSKVVVRSIGGDDDESDDEPVDEPSPEPAMGVE